MATKRYLHILIVILIFTAGCLGSVEKSQDGVDKNRSSNTSDVQKTWKKNVEYVELPYQRNSTPVLEKPRRLRIVNVDGQNHSIKVSMYDEETDKKLFTKTFMLPHDEMKQIKNITLSPGTYLLSIELRSGITNNETVEINSSNLGTEIRIENGSIKYSVISKRSMRYGGAWISSYLGNVSDNLAVYNASEDLVYNVSNDDIPDLISKMVKRHYRCRRDSSPSYCKNYYKDSNEDEYTVSLNSSRFHEISRRLSDLKPYKGELVGYVIRFKNEVYKLTLTTPV